MKRIILSAVAVAFAAVLAAPAAVAQDNWDAFWNALGAGSRGTNSPCQAGDAAKDLSPAQINLSGQSNPESAAKWNALGDVHAESGAITNAFADYARAIELSPANPAYYRNLAAIIYVFRKDAMAFYGINEPEVFDKALALYREAVRLDPGNFDLAAEYAESFYEIQPFRANDALAAWTNALNVARSESERERVFLHLARIKLALGRLNEARAHLDAVTEADNAVIRNRLEHNLAAREKELANASGGLVER